jgi:preprotein translocase subunit YajC
MKQTLNQMFLVIVTATILSAPLAMAQTNGAAQPSAPDVVAPAQPASAQNVTSTTVATTTPAPAQPSMLGMAAPFLIMLGIMYFLMIRPQQKRLKDHQSLLTGLKTGDDVITTSGIFGRVTSMDDKVVSLEVSKNVVLKVLKTQVNQVLKGTEVQA